MSITLSMGDPSKEGGLDFDLLAVVGARGCGEIATARTTALVLGQFDELLTHG